jgi:hypothetical protein
LFSKSEIDSIRERADIVRVISSYGHQLRRTGKSYKCCCPFHAESTPSFDVDPEKKTFHCFGCDAGGDVFKFVMLADSIEFPAAVQKVAEGCGIKVQKEWRPMQVEEGAGSKSDDGRAEKVFKRFADPKVISVADWKPWAVKFQNSSWAREEMRSRGIPMELCKEAMLGWRDDGKGICRPDHDHIDKPWIGFPYIWGDKVRLIKWRLAFSVGKDFLRLAGMEDCLFIDGDPDKLEEIFLAEGEVDALTLRLIGLRACSIPSGFQSKINKATRDYLLGFRKVYACVDNDDEGKALLRRLLLDFPSDKLSVVTIPEKFKDANGLYVKGCGRDVDDFRRQFADLVETASRPSTLAFADLDQSFELYLQRLREKKADKFWEWPWPGVERMAIIAPGQVVTVLSSRSGQGKTSFTLQASLYNALRLGRRIGYYTAEVDPVEEMVPMVSAQLTETDRNELLEGDVKRARELCRNADFYLGFDPEAKGWDDVAVLLEMAVKRIGIDVIVIDHLDFIIRDADWSRQNAMKSLATRWLKTKLARKYGVLVIVLKQTTKASSKGRFGKSQAADAYDQSGPSTQVDDADHVLILDRPKRTKLSEADGEDIYQNDTKVILGKSRRKGKGASVTTLNFCGKYAKFEQSEGRREPDNEPPPEHLPYKD